MKQAPNILLYTRSEEETEQRFRSAIETAVAGRTVNVSDDIGSLTGWLSDSPYSGTILLILVDTKEDLVELLSVRKLLFDVRTILVLPDKNSDTVAIGHSLRPRFISYKDGNFLDVAAVLGKMIETTAAPPSFKITEEAFRR